MTWTTPPVSKIAPDGTAYDLSGPEKAPCVVLIHGLGLSRQLWDMHLPALAGYRVLRYDLYGHGDSAPAPSPATLTLFARQIAGLLAQEDIARAHIVGFSIGGMINRRFAMDYPDKAASLAILNSPHDRGEAAQLAVEERAKSVRDQGAFSTFDAALKRWFTPGYLANGDGPARVRAWREMVDAETYAQTAWVLAHGVRELIAPDPPITLPSLVMTCAHDSGSTPQMSHDIGSEIAGSQTIIIPTLQHLGLIEDPTAFTNPILDFLKKVPT
ncbi:alpha/beta fold hydrolase [Loktanella sp. Alg231-35]|uniref:alpha/beta fold hydrolase n=1 Tax=Loktanella sp. Alg231-35 TaxID=1922220 RepID=UPI001F1A91A2|nr:alpha/beta fold hydrolase [Loktanella sp. Alg231-35]